MLKRRTASKRQAELQLSDSDSDSDGSAAGGGFDVDANAAAPDASEGGFLSLNELQALGAKTQAKLTSAGKGKGKKGAAGAGDDATAVAGDNEGVVYLGHIPHGFYEEQMKGFFSQFGTISKLRLSRSKKTGRSRHYAFLQFKDAEVAEVVADTMNGYILEGRHLVCKVVPSERVHERMFAGASRKFRAIPWRTVAKRRHNAKRDPQRRKTKLAHLMRKDNAKRKRLAELGIDYDFAGYEGVVQSVHDARAASAAKAGKKGKKGAKGAKGKKAAASEEAAAAPVTPATQGKRKKQRKTPKAAVADAGATAGDAAGAGGASAPAATPKKAGRKAKGGSKKVQAGGAATARAAKSAKRTQAKASKKRRKSLA